jgi:hypothetical protein
MVVMAMRAAVMGMPCTHEAIVPTLSLNIDVFEYFPTPRGGARPRAKG